MACPSINYSMNPFKKERGLGALTPRELAGRLIPSQPSNQLIILCTVAPSLQKKNRRRAPSFKNNNFCFETTIDSITTDSMLINLTRSPRQKTRETTTNPSEIASFWTSSPLNVRCPPWGVWIFSGTTQYLENYKTVCDDSDQKGAS